MTVRVTKKIKMCQSRPKRTKRGDFWTVFRVIFGLFFNDDQIDGQNTGQIDGKIDGQM